MAGAMGPTAEERHPSASAQMARLRSSKGSSTEHTTPSIKGR